MNTEGLYPMSQEMPCATWEISIWRYTIPSTLGSFEEEEATARILSVSLEAWSWFGMSRQRLADMMREDQQAHERACQVSRRNSEDTERFKRAMKYYYALGALTLGLYNLFAEKPILRQEKVEHTPTSGIFVWGFGHVWQGVDALLERGMLRCEKIDGDDVFFPTPALVSRILTVQRMQRSAGG